MRYETKLLSFDNYRTVQEVCVWPRKGTHEQYEQIVWDAPETATTMQTSGQTAL